MSAAEVLTLDHGHPADGACDTSPSLAGWPLAQTEARKRCPKCDQTKPLSEFGKDSNLKDGHKVYCRPCANAYQSMRRRERFAIDPEGERRKVGPSRKRHNRRAAQLRRRCATLKRELGCAACGRKRVILHFHHLDPADKLYDISAVCQMAVPRILAELNKCVVLCVSCHGLLHNDALHATAEQLLEGQARLRVLAPERVYFIERRRRPST